MKTVTDTIRSGKRSEERRSPHAKHDKLSSHRWVISDKFYFGTLQFHITHKKYHIKIKIRGNNIIFVIVYWKAKKNFILLFLYTNEQASAYNALSSFEAIKE